MKEKCVGFVIRVVINCVVGGEMELHQAREAAECWVWRSQCHSASHWLNGLRSTLGELEL